MNLRAIANNAIVSINPNIKATLELQSSYTTDETGKRIAQPAELVLVNLQIQALTAQEIQRLDGGLLQQSEHLSAYITGQLHSLRRITGQGAERLYFARYGDNKPCYWLITSIVESWQDWCKVIICKQK